MFFYGFIENDPSDPGKSYPYRWISSGRFHHP